MKFIEKESRMGVVRGRGREIGELFNGDTVSVWDIDEVLKMDIGDGCTTM